MNDLPDAGGIGLALSGGGVRAAAFHCGVLKYLAHNGLMEQVSQVSTVSGGSLLTGLLMSNCNNNWPSSRDYLDRTLGHLRKVLTTQSLQASSIVALLMPWNWKHLLSRAHVTAQTIETLWNVKGTLADLPTSPVWSINATTAENGRRFRFKGGQIGDYELGYARAPDFKIAQAMAVSAAFPGGIGPLRLESEDYVWMKKKNWKSLSPAEVISLPFRQIHLYDGGVYDNLGIEPLFDVGRQAIKPKVNISCLVISDAGAAFERCRIPGPLSLGRLKRVADVMADQARALRVRSVLNFLKNNPGKARYLQIGAPPIARIEEYGSKCEANDHLAALPWLDDHLVARAASYATSLRQMHSRDFDLLVQHGFETAKWNWELNFKSGLDTSPH